MSSRASVAGTFAVGSMRWWSWRVGTRIKQVWLIEMIDRGTMPKDDLHTMTVGARLHVKCYTKHF